MALRILVTFVGLPDEEFDFFFLGADLEVVDGDDLPMLNDVHVKRSAVDSMTLIQY